MRYQLAGGHGHLLQPPHPQKRIIFISRKIKKTAREPQADILLRNGGKPIFRVQKMNKRVNNEY